MAMIEQVARAMYERMEGERGNIVAKWDDLHLPVRLHFMEGARAAIQAMREPSSEMVEVGSTHVVDIDPDLTYSGPRDAARETYASMVDAALSDAETKARAPVTASAAVPAH